MGKIPLLDYNLIITGLHSLHVAVGIGVLTIVAWLAVRQKYSAEYHKPVIISRLKPGENVERR